MKNSFKWVAVCSLAMAAGAGTVIAQDDQAEPPKIVPVEIYVCNYHDGKGPADLDGWSTKWNAWADGQAMAPYSAYTMTPFYYGPDQDFDFLWLGVSPDAASMGRAQDAWLSSSGSLP